MVNLAKAQISNNGSVAKTFVIGSLVMGVLMICGSIFAVATSECGSRLKFNTLTSEIELSKDACPKTNNSPH
ncbi:hypothetical protein [Nostoc sp. 'Peltigera membranacea cyanobiont' N6]|jgi:hypothetical protein|uniref:hypothetical protein n=1 Tax=Nostoc sp. 'Peltigera membranacea cyanobiont' N6 TaxID=1261031 RepID=UPI000CF317DA|nr:hypothetical protein [Nostoc sp. 'Peltigera membranacea cyanobiont' N6]